MDEELIYCFLPQSGQKFADSGVLQPHPVQKLGFLTCSVPQSGQKLAPAANVFWHEQQQLLLSFVLSVLVALPLSIMSAFIFII